MCNDYRGQIKVLTEENKAVRQQLNDSCEETKRLTSQVQALIKQIEEAKQKLGEEEVKAKSVQGPKQALTEQIETDQQTQGKTEEDIPKGKGIEGADQQVFALMLHVHFTILMLCCLCFTCSSFMS